MKFIDFFAGIGGFRSNAISSSQLNSAKLNKVSYNPVFP